jgi:hypothetical protein
LLCPHEERHPLNRPGCSVSGCEQEHTAKGLCQAHYYRQKRYGRTDVVGRVARPRRACLERDADGNKYCPTCKKWLQELSFCRNASQLDGLANACRNCTSRRKRDMYRKQHPEVKTRSSGVALERDENGNKQCARCRQWIPEAEYTRNASQLDGLQGTCRGCTSKYQSERYSAQRGGNVRRRGPRRGYGESIKRDEAGRKYCPGCTEWLPELRFTKNPRTADKLQSRCTVCCANAKRQDLYGVTPEAAAEMLAGQGGMCPICDKDISKSYFVDHDHACCPGRKSCGKCVRSLLCSLCNTGIGYLQDDAALLMKAAEYLILRGRSPYSESEAARVLAAENQMAS